jgi:hypothetical protein
MATPEFILQGFTANTHIDALQRLFDLPDVQSVLVSVAFVSEGGVERLEAHLIPHRACATVFAGIRNGTTSYQGLARLHHVVNELYTVDTGSRTLEGSVSKVFPILGERRGCPMTSFTSSTFQPTIRSLDVRPIIHSVGFPPVTCYVFLMASTPKKTKPRTPKQRMASRRERLRARGLRPVQHWVPDLRDPKVLAEIRREIELMAQHPENDAIDDWIESVYDWESWK